MGFCIWGISWAACSTRTLFTWILSLFVQGLPTPIAFLAALIISSILLYILGMVLAKVGPIFNAVIGIAGLVGAAFTMGATIIIAIIGFVMAAFGRPWLLVGINIALFIICALCYGL
jgi:hypothetical protein